MQSKPLMIVLALVVLAGGWLVARMFSTSDEFGHLEVQTYQLEYMEPEAAWRVIEPYVFADRGGTTSIDDQTRTITVRETPEMLSRIGDVLQKYDLPEPSVKLQFRLVEANGGAPSDDPRLDEVKAALPEDVFRFRNYRIAGEAIMTGIEHSGVAQGVATDSERYHIEAGIGDVNATDQGGTVKLHVSLESSRHGQIFATAVNARIGQLLVLGSAQPESDRSAVILTVKPELVRN
jgi:hypothetical protein